jgi:hypothetical protein
MGKKLRKIPGFKNVVKVFDKVVPNEIKPALPYLAAAFPFLAPGMYSSMAAGLGNLGFTNPAFIEMAQRGLISGGLNLAAQLPQEGVAERGINPLSLALAVGSGALTAPGGADALRGMQSASNLGDIGTETVSRSFLQKAGDFGLEGLAKGSEYLSAAASPEAGFMQAVKGATPGLTFAAGEQAYNTALDAQREFELANQGFQDFTGQQLADFSAGRRAAILASMGRAGFGEDEINATLAQLDLRNGGRVGYKNAGIVSLTDEDSGVMYYDENGKPISKEKAMKLFEKQAEEENKVKEIENKNETKKKTKLDRSLIDKIFLDEEGSYRYPFQIMRKAGEDAFLFGELNPELRYREFDKMPMDYQNKVEDRREDLRRFYQKYDYKKAPRYEQMADGGIISLMGGGMPSMEMDYRGGGFIPVGAKERADDVPARLSKNEFVMTADAVRAAGGGSVNEGARRMYELMNNLEARA